MIPIRIVPYSSRLPDRLFGGLPDFSPCRGGACLTFFVLALDSTRLLHVGLTADFREILAHAGLVTPSDDKVLSIHEIPVGTPFQGGKVFHEAVSLERQPAVTDDDVESTADVHKIGGASYYLLHDPSPDLEFVAQIAFPDHRDLLLSLDWPTGEYTFELLRDRGKREYCAVWRMHA